MKIRTKGSLRNACSRLAPTERPPAVKLATQPNRGRNSRASTTRRRRSPWRERTRRRLASIVTSRPTWRPSSSQQTSPPRPPSVRIATRIFTADSSRRTASLLASSVTTPRSGNHHCSITTSGLLSPCRVCTRMSVVRDATKSFGWSKARRYSSICRRQSNARGATRQGLCPQARASWGQADPAFPHSAKVMHSRLTGSTVAFNYRK